MALARGEYIKLHGDKVCFYELELTKLIEQLKTIDVGVIFMLNGYGKLNKNNPIDVYSFDEFVEYVSFYSTWMNGIILRRADYNNLENPERLAGNYLIQTDILFRIISSQSRIHILNHTAMFEQPISGKGGYNLFKVFVNNYLSLYTEYLQNGKLSQITYENEKRKLLRHFVFPWYTSAVLLHKQAFETTKATRIIFTEFKKTPLLYAFPFYILGRVWKIIVRNI
jgi:hypothetical protein